jgi:hypothetical protein
MINTTWTDALAGMTVTGLDVRPRAVRCAPEAFTAPFQGSGLPFGGAVVETVAPAAPQRTTDDVHIGTTLGLSSSRRSPG